MVICVVEFVWLGVGYSDSSLFGLYSIVCGEGLRCAVDVGGFDVLLKLDCGFDFELIVGLSGFPIS